MRRTRSKLKKRSLLKVTELLTRHQLQCLMYDCRSRTTAGAVGCALAWHSVEQTLLPKLDAAVTIKFAHDVCDTLSKQFSDKLRQNEHAESFKYGQIS